MVEELKRILSEEVEFEAQSLAGLFGVQKALPF